ncbi:MAG: 1,4-dihydroxy-2-naphthoate polyprenyltransferase [Planctomycetota bacterium]
MTARPEGAAVWVAAARPKTLPAAVAPVLMGTALAWRDGGLHVGMAAVALTGALLLQLGTNFANDYHDFVKGADTEERLGPPRATQQGWVKPGTMRAATTITFALAVVVGVVLYLRAGWPIAAIGATGIACGLLYTGGPRPFGYLGLGDILVLVFFGPVAVAGTHFVQTLEWSATATVAGAAPGLLATALLAINNLRDAETDAKAGKRTLAVRFGRGFAKAEVAAGVAVAALIPVGLWLAGALPSTGMLATAAAVALGTPAVVAVGRARPGDRLLGPLATLGRTLLVYGIAFAVGLWLSPRPLLQ